MLIMLANGWTRTFPALFSDQSEDRMVKNRRLRSAYSAILAHHVKDPITLVEPSSLQTGSCKKAGVTFGKPVMAIYVGNVQEEASF